MVVEHLPTMVKTLQLAVKTHAHTHTPIWPIPHPFNADMLQQSTKSWRESLGELPTGLDHRSGIGFRL